MSETKKRLPCSTVTTTTKTRCFLCRPGVILFACHLAGAVFYFIAPPPPLPFVTRAQHRLPLTRCVSQVFLSSAPAAAPGDEDTRPRCVVKLEYCGDAGTALSPGDAIFLRRRIGNVSSPGLPRRHPLPATPG